MKKMFIALGICSLAMLASCGNSDKKAAADQTDAVVENVTETTTIDPYIAALQQSDSTVMVTPSGLGYKIIKQTRGITPSPESTVKVKYTGKHVDGTVFDSSNGEAVEFPLEMVIPGFREGIALMPMGSTYELYIPGNLAYGPQGIPGVIAPNELLIFEVELDEIE